MQRDTALAAVMLDRGAEYYRLGTLRRAMGLAYGDMPALACSLRRLAQYGIVRVIGGRRDRAYTAIVNRDALARWVRRRGSEFIPSI
jgi:hypothetical protein